MYQLLKQEGRARRGEFTTVHGTVQTPAFMNVATSAAIKGGISSFDLKELRCQVELCNTYHLHIRPGDRVIRQLGGLHRFTGWTNPSSPTAAVSRCSPWPACGGYGRRG